jgi:hypothetical protein
MKTSSAKSKGRRLCSAVKEILHEWSPDIPYDDILVTSSGVTGEDLKLSARALEVYPYTLECKNHERLNIWEALKQAQGHAAGKPLTPLLLFTRNREKHIYVTLKFQDFLRLTR